MEIFITDDAKNDFIKWQKSGNKKAMTKIDNLLLSVSKTPYHGIGKPEALKHDLTGCWSREITQKDRMVYKVETDKIIILSAIGHYKDK
jgi:toxin YoeB